jgi:hypothetical protein
MLVSEDLDRNYGDHFGIGNPHKPNIKFSNSIQLIPSPLNSINNEIISYTKTSVTLDGDKEEISISIYPDDIGKNISNIDGKYRNMLCNIGEKELRKLPLMLKGTGIHLSDKIKSSISGKINADGNFTIFVSSLATTLVEFKLIGKIFPETGIKRITPRIFNYKILNNLSKLAEGNNKLGKWIDKIVGFWNQWKFMFRDLNKKDYLEDLVDEQNKQIAELKRDMCTLQNEIEELKALVHYGSCK